MELQLSDKGQIYLDKVGKIFGTKEISTTQESDFIVLNHFHHTGSMALLEDEDSRIRDWFKTVVRRLFEAGYLEEV